MGDLVAAVAGAALLILSLVDSLASWPSNRVLVVHDDLSRIAGAVLVPCWIWLLVSLFLVVRPRAARRDTQEEAARRAAEMRIWRAMFPDRRLRLGLGVIGILCLGVVIGGFVVGGAKGSSRILPGPSYQISTADLNDDAWTPVAPQQYTLWQARFIREDGLFTVFGLALAGGSLGLLQLHHTTRRQTTSSRMTGGPDPINRDGDHVR
ncbi:hypothetical protein OG500_37555 [Kitasatospora sp. NBC_01250]|uniref:hypothetical protein n=1 Tax=Kitasatospora sp. NBC_01250 TaxID=2903571 RepID=UPI002E2F9B7F|nr:hypothetical protein [Kitasatospora sp. NBC_01250]